jgi:hypothetical protein
LEKKMPLQIGGIIEAKKCIAAMHRRNGDPPPLPENAPVCCAWHRPNVILESAFFEKETISF